MNVAQLKLMRYVENLWFVEEFPRLNERGSIEADPYLTVPTSMVAVSTFE